MAKHLLSVLHVWYNVYNCVCIMYEPLGVYIMRVCTVHAVTFYRGPYEQMPH